MSMSGEKIVQQALILYGLSITKHYSTASTLYHEVFQELENLVTDDQAVCDEVINDARVIPIRRKLRESYLQCVYDLEIEWVQSFLMETKEFELKRYPKYEQYRLRAFFEYYSIPIISNKSVNHILFVGCGPLPLTSIIMRSIFGVRVDFLDIKPQAINLAEKLIKKLNLEKDSTFIVEDAYEFKDFATYDAIFVAGSVGLEESDKSKLIKHFSSNMRIGQFLVLRPPYQIEKLLVSDFSMNDFSDFKITVAQIINNDDIVYRLIAEKK